VALMVRMLKLINRFLVAVNTRLINYNAGRRQ
jgi:hypothetical protein